MANVLPFKSIRPRADLVDKIAALPYDVYNSSEARKVVAANPLSFLKIDRPETMFADTPELNMYAPEVYQQAHDTLWQMVSDGEFVRDTEDSFYIYMLTMNGRSQTGIVGLASVAEYMNGTIKKHENTLAIKEQDRINHIDTCNAQTGPIFLAYRANETLTSIINDVKKSAPPYDFTSEDGISHTVWVVSKSADIAGIREAFDTIDSLYIADGHHRAASAVKCSIMRHEDGKDKESDHFLSVIFPDNELMIMDYNRVVKDLNGLSSAEFIKKISEVFEILPKDTEVTPAAKYHMGMYLDGKWYECVVKAQYRSDDPISGLDVSVLQDNILDPILGIQDPKNDKRIDFVGGIRGLGELVRRVDTDMKVAFAMYPTTIAELFAVADAGLLMPPKSTWFEPKLRSGIFIHEI